MCLYKNVFGALTKTYGDEVDNSQIITCTDSWNPRGKLSVKPNGKMPCAIRTVAIATIVNGYVACKCGTNATVGVFGNGSGMQSITREIQVWVFYQNWTNRVHFIIHSPGVYMKFFSKAAMVAHQPITARIWMEWSALLLHRSRMLQL